MTCVNLQERFGRRYRVSWEADGATKGLWPKDEWLWLMEIRGRHGVVSPKGGDVLQALTPRRRVGAKLRALPWCVAIALGRGRDGRHVPRGRCGRRFQAHQAVSTPAGVRNGAPSPGDTQCPLRIRCRAHQ